MGGRYPVSVIRRRGSGGLRWVVLLASLGTLAGCGGSAGAPATNTVQLSGNLRGTLTVTSQSCQLVQPGGSGGIGVTLDNLSGTVTGADSLHRVQINLGVPQEGGAYTFPNVPSTVFVVLGGNGRGLWLAAPSSTSSSGARQPGQGSGEVTVDAAGTSGSIDAVLAPEHGNPSGRDQSVQVQGSWKGCTSS